MGKKECLKGINYRLETKNAKTQHTMTPSDFLILLSIIIAVISMVEANNKKIWLYKFNYIDLSVGILIFAIVLFLIWYDSIIAHCSCIKYEWFYNSHGLNSKTWAYVISILILFIFIVRVLLQKCFPQKRREDLLKYYKRLIHSDIGMLIDYLYQYHFHEETIDNYVLPIYTDKTFIRKSVEIDQTIFLKLLVADKECGAKKKTFDAVGYYITCVVKNEHGQFLQELSELNSYLWVNSIENIFTNQIEKDGIFEEIFKDKTYILPSFMLVMVGIMAKEQLLHSRYFDEEPSVFLGMNQNLIYNTYLQLYFVILFYYISTSQKSASIMRSCYFIENKLYSLLPQYSDSKNRISNKKRLTDNIDTYYNVLLCYCDEHNYIDNFSSLINLRLEMYCKNPQKSLRYEDVWALFDIYINRKVEWKNVDCVFKQSLKEIIELNPQLKKKLELDIFRNKNSCVFPERINFLMTLLTKE